MSKEFDPRTSLEALITILRNYEQNESVEIYSEECYIEDVLFFLGKSIDEEKYGYDACAYRKFIAQKIAPFSDKIARMVFEHNLKRGGS